MTSLVVKKGSKICFSTPGAIPEPVSPMRKRTPRRSDSRPFSGAARTDGEPSTARHGVDGVAHQIGEDLSEFSRKAEEIDAGVVALGDEDFEVAQPSLVKAEDGIQQVAEIGPRREGGGTVETERLLGDLRDAMNLVFGHDGVGVRRFVEVGMAAEKIKQVGNCFEGIVDLVSDGCGEAAGSGQFFGLAQGFLGSACGRWRP